MLKRRPKDRISGYLDLEIFNLEVVIQPDKEIQDLYESVIKKQEGSKKKNKRRFSFYKRERGKTIEHLYLI